MNRKEFIQLPIEERRKILAEQANNPEIIAYYNSEERLMSLENLVDLLRGMES